MKNRPIYRSYRFKMLLLSNKIGLSLYDFFHKIYLDRVIKKSDPSRLILVIGVGRCGSTWISDTLSRSNDVDIFLEEPLYKLSFPLILNNFKYYEHTAISINSHSKYFERLNRCFESFNNTNNISSLFKKSLVSNCLRKNTGNNVTLVKEVHALFGYDGITKKDNIKCIYIKRDIIEHLDSLISYIPRQSDLLKLEYDSLQDPYTLSLIYGELQEDFHKMIRDVELLPDRHAFLVSKMITINSLNRFYSIKSKENHKVMIVEYNEIIMNRDESFKKISDFAGISYTAGSYILNDREHTLRSDEELLNRKYKSLSKEDVTFLKEFLNKWNVFFDLK